MDLINDVSCKINVYPTIKLATIIAGSRVSELSTPIGPNQFRTMSHQNLPVKYRDDFFFYVFPTTILASTPFSVMQFASQPNSSPLKLRIFYFGSIFHYHVIIKLCCAHQNLMICPQTKYVELYARRYQLVYLKLICWIMEVGLKLATPEA